MVNIIQNLQRGYSIREALNNALSERVMVPDYGETFDKAQIDLAVAEADGKVLDFGNGYEYTCNGPILIGGGAGRSTPIAIVGRSKITFTYNQPDNLMGFGNPERQLSGLHCWAVPESGLSIDIQDLTLVYTGTFDEGTNNGRVNGLFLYGVKGGSVERVKASGFNACGAYIGGAGSKTGGGSYDTVDTEGVTVRHCDFSGNRVAGLEIGNTRSITCEVSDLNNNGKAGDTGTGYGFAAQSGTENINVAVVRTTANGNFRKGIDFHSGDGFIVDTCTCDGNLLYGIFASTRCKGKAAIRSCRVTGMSAASGLGLPVYGIYVGQDQSVGATLRISLEDNFVSGGQDTGELFYPFVLRSGGDNKFTMIGNSCDCEDVTHYVLSDNNNGTTDISAHFNEFSADEVTSFWFRAYQQNILNLDITNNTFVDRSAAYFQASAISFDAGTPPAGAASAVRNVTGNSATVTAASALTRFFAGDGHERGNFLNGKRLIADPEYTISSGAITIGDYESIRVDTEGDAATDDLDTITATFDRHRVVVTAASSSRDIVLKDGTGNLELSADMTLTHGTDFIELMYRASNAVWQEVSRSDNRA